MNRDEHSVARGSKCLSLVSSVSSRFRALLGSSRLHQLVRRQHPVERVSTAQDSGEVSPAEMEPTRRIPVGFFARTAERLRTASRQSRVRGFVSRLRRTVVASWCYRWLTAEPEPEVVVIDLRETRTVGPLLVLIEWVIDRLVSLAETSGLCKLGRRTAEAVSARPVQVASICVGSVAAASFVLLAATGGLSSSVFVGLAVVVLASFFGSQVTYSWAQLTDTRLYRALAAAFEPPEPPAGDDSSGDSSRSVVPSQNTGSDERE